MGEYSIELDWSLYGTRHLRPMIHDLVGWSGSAVVWRSLCCESLGPICSWSSSRARTGCQHNHWHLLDKTHPMYDAKTAPARAAVIIEYYKALDGILGEFRAEVGPDVPLILLGPWLRPGPPAAVLEPLAARAGLPGLARRRFGHGAAHDELCHAGGAAAAARAPVHVPPAGHAAAADAPEVDCAVTRTIASRRPTWR